MTALPSRTGSPMRSTVARLTLLAALGTTALAARTTPVRAQSADHDAAYRVVTTLFDAMRARDTAAMRAYVIGMGVGKDGRAVTVNGRYYFDVRRTEAGWKATRYTMDFLMPLSGTLDNAK